MNKNSTVWIQEQIQLLMNADSKESLLHGLEKSARLLGFDYFAYGIRAVTPASAPKVLLLNNYPKQWQEIYDDQNYVEIDPTVHQGLKSIMPIIWNEALFADALALWEDARAFGLSHGWAQSSVIRPGASGLITLARSGDPLSDLELAYKTPLLVWFNQLAQMGLQKHLLPEIIPNSQVRLTPREAEILRWTADGKTAYEISVILAITERTVNFHLNNTISKFNVTNKIAAAVQAVVHGII